MPLTANVEINVAGITATLSAVKKRSITLKGARAAGKVLKVAARAQAPKRAGGGGGSLKRAQSVRVAKGSKGVTTASYAVQGSKKKFERMIRPKGRNKPVRVVPAFYDHLVQLGTKPHRLGKGESLGRDATKKRKAVVRTAQTGGGRHPGTRADPFRLRAWESVKGAAGRAALDAMAEETRAVIAKEARKVAAAAALARKVASAKARLGG